MIPLSAKVNKLNPRGIYFTMILYDLLLPILFIHTWGCEKWNLFYFKKGRAASHIRIRYIDRCIPAVDRSTDSAGYHHYGHVLFGGIK